MTVFAAAFPGACALAVGSFARRRRNDERRGVLSMYGGLALRFGLFALLLVSSRAEGWGSSTAPLGLAVTIHDGNQPLHQHHGQP